MDNQFCPKIAIVARKGLGDGLINLLIAGNLRLNNYEVTLYHNFVSQLSAWLSQDIIVKLWPAPECCEKEFSQYDLVLADDSSVLGKPYQKKEDYPALSRKYVYLGIGKVESRLIWDHSSRLKEVLPQEKYERLRELASCAGTIKHQHGNRNYSQVENAVIFCREKLKLKNVTREIQLVPPAQLDLKYKKHPNRVIIHPFSAYERKNWPLKKYIKLADKLKDDGLSPVFICSPAERQKLVSQLKDNYEVPTFPTVSELASYTYESGLFIGNDSGPAHLASALNIPAVTIMFHKRNFYWRPDFSQPGALILPPVNIVAGPKSVWKWFVPVSRVYKETMKVIAQINKDNFC